jgi:hypothetical protein
VKEHQNVPTINPIPLLELTEESEVTHSKDELVLEIKPFEEKDFLDKNLTENKSEMDQENNKNENHLLILTPQKIHEEDRTILSNLITH